MPAMCSGRVTRTSRNHLRAGGLIDLLTRNHVRCQGLPVGELCSAIAASDFTQIPVLDRKVDGERDAHTVDTAILVGVISAPGPVASSIPNGKGNGIFGQSDACMRGLQIGAILQGDPLQFLKRYEL